MVHSSAWAQTRAVQLGILSCKLFRFARTVMCCLIEPSRWDSMPLDHTVDNNVLSIDLDPLPQKLSVWGDKA